MDRQEKVIPKQVRYVVVVPVLLLLAILLGWAWRSGAWPFADLEANNGGGSGQIDLLEDVQYITPSLRFAPFEAADTARYWGTSDMARRWEKSGFDGNPRDYRFKSKPPAPPFYMSPRLDDLSRFLGYTLSAEGFDRPPKPRDAPEFDPRPRPNKDTYSPVSRATLETVVRTYRQGDIVVFKVETCLIRDIRADFSRDALISVKLGAWPAESWAVAEKDAPEAIRTEIQREARSLLGRLRHSEFTSAQLRLDL